MSWEANVMPNSDHKLMFEPGVEVEKDLIEFVKHEDDYGEPTPEEEAVIRMANGLLIGFGIFVSLSYTYLSPRHLLIIILAYYGLSNELKCG